MIKRLKMNSVYFTTLSLPKIMVAVHILFQNYASVTRAFQHVNIPVYDCFRKISPRHTNDMIFPSKRQSMVDAYKIIQQRPTFIVLSSWNSQDGPGYEDENPDDLYNDLYRRMEELGMQPTLSIETNSEILKGQSGNDIPFSYYEEFYERQNITQTSLDWQRLVDEEKFMSEAEEQETIEKSSAGSQDQVDAGNVSIMRAKYFEQFRKTRESLNTKSPTDEPLGSLSDAPNNNDLIPTPEPVLFQEEPQESSKIIASEADISDEKTWAELMDAAEKDQNEKLGISLPSDILDQKKSTAEANEVSVLSLDAMGPTAVQELSPEEESDALDPTRRKYYNTVWMARNVRKLRPDQLAAVASPTTDKLEGDPEKDFQLPVQFSAETINRLEAVERKHSRAAMLGLGMLAGLVSQGFFNPEDLKTLLSVWQVDVTFAVVMLYELKYFAGKGKEFEISIENSVMEWLNANAIQNKKHDICAATFLKQLKLSEIKHGRMAMIAITFFFLESSWAQVANAFPF